ncbi:hypothetical protein [Flavobacterium sp.]|uniref:hypothetical protein n=1 Tax=Flavobacterium sp. TaxID=239 RepID=UPI002BF06F1A|nr:hypothetical protein [Flavobacterium sp.]HSD07588.1 hypothetical protein [Flavobacterium sp.]
MKILDKNSEALQSLLKIDHQRIINSSESTEIGITPINEDMYLTGQESLLFQMYDLEEENLFI